MSRNRWFQCVGDVQPKRAVKVHYISAFQKQIGSYVYTLQIKNDNAPKIF